MSTTQQQLDYEQAMALVVKDADGVTVMDVHASLFRTRLYAAARAAGCLYAVKREVELLQLRWRPDRWQALRVLQSYGIPLSSVVDDDGTSARADEQRMV